MEKIHSLEEIRQLQASFQQAAKTNVANQQAFQESKKQKTRGSLVAALLNWLTY